MASNPRPGLRTIIEAAGAIQAHASIRGSAKPTRRPPIEQSIVLRLRQVGDAIDQLAPAVRALRPDAPWSTADMLRHLDPFRGRLSDVPGLKPLLMEEIPAVAKAAAEIITELDGAGIIAPRPAVAPPALYQFNITLADITPPIWRRLLLPNTLTLSRLHLAIQIAGGWCNYHLHLFEIAGTRYGAAGPDAELNVRSDTHVRLNALSFSPGSRFRYLYDFGDDWRHRVEIEAVQEIEVGALPALLGGARSAPPEDCGGLPGYEQIQRAYAGTSVDEWGQELAQWTRMRMGPLWTPETFDAELIRDRLSRTWRGPRT